MKKITTLSLVALFAGSLMLGGCATDTLTGPEVGTGITTTIGGDGDDYDPNDGQGTSGIGDHNTGNMRTKDQHGSGGGTSGVGDHNTGN